MNIEQPELQVPIWEKYSLNIEEAAAYFGIGEKTLLLIGKGAFFYKIILDSALVCGSLIA